MSDDLRFARHLNLAGVGPEGQRRLAAASAEVRGRGLRGWVARRYLEAAGVGQVSEGAPGEQGGWAAGHVDDPSCRAVVEGALDALDELRGILTR